MFAPNPLPPNFAELEKRAAAAAAKAANAPTEASAVSLHGGGGNSAPAANGPFMGQYSATLTD